METILRWLARRLAGILEKYADPDLQARVDAQNARAAALNAEGDKLAGEIAESILRNNQLTKALNDETRRRQELDDAISKAKNDLAAKNAAVLADPDDDIERPLP